MQKPGDSLVRRAGRGLILGKEQFIPKARGIQIDRTLPFGDRFGDLPSW